MEYGESHPIPSPDQAGEPLENQLVRDRDHVLDPDNMTGPMTELPELPEPPTEHVELILFCHKTMFFRHSLQATYVLRIQ
jgi:hypothetical protein